MGTRSRGRSEASVSNDKRVTGAVARLGAGCGQCRAPLPFWGRPGGCPRSAAVVAAGAVHRRVFHALS